MSGQTWWSRQDEIAQNRRDHRKAKEEDVDMMAKFEANQIVADTQKEIIQIRAENDRLKADAAILRMERDKLKAAFAEVISGGDYDSDPEWWQLVALQSAGVYDKKQRDPRKDLF